MASIIPKPVSLDEQIKFVQDARRLMEKHPDVEISWTADSIEHLRAVEENLMVIRGWHNLPAVHQAANLAINQAAELVKSNDAAKKIARRGILNLFGEMRMEIESIYAKDNQDEDYWLVVLESLSAQCLLGVAEFVIKK